MLESVRKFQIHAPHDCLYWQVTLRATPILTTYFSAVVRGEPTSARDSDSHHLFSLQCTAESLPQQMLSSPSPSSRPHAPHASPHAPHAPPHAAHAPPPLLMLLLNAPHALLTLLTLSSTFLSHSSSVPHTPPHVPRSPRTPLVNVSTLVLSAVVRCTAVLPPPSCSPHSPHAQPCYMVKSATDRPHTRHSPCSPSQPLSAVVLLRVLPDATALTTLHHHPLSGCTAESFSPASHFSCC